MVRVCLWQRVQESPAEALGAVANQNETAKAVASMMPADVEVKAGPIDDITEFFHIKEGAVLRVL